MTEQATSTDVSTQHAVFNDETLAGISSWSDALALMDRLSQAGELVAESFTDYGTGFKVTEKSALVGVPMMLLEWRFNSGDYGDDGFVSVTAVTKDGRKVIFNDGSTGILAQLRLVTEQRIKKGLKQPQAALFVEGGLSKSDYTVQLPDKNGELKPSPATTFYLAE